ncbi:vWA domain-containing protein [Algivirga pacifica]|uniref:VWFA domain-containing protein n=1 Tax=Algivirga pacifica TaxID=1162670 RepID=A0ABP9DEM6_9BACT
MTFGRDFGMLEISLIIAFVVLYGLYLFRVYRVSKVLGTPMRATIYKLLLRTLYFGLFLVALRGPAYKQGKKEMQTIGKDIYMCVDLSKSMDTEDIAPSRLQRVKFLLKEIVSNFSSDRLGLIVFTNEAFLQCPLTFDGSALNLFIEAMSTNLIFSSGTDFGPPLRLAIKKLKEAQETVTTDVQSKTILLISDGEDFGEETTEVLQEIKDENIRLFTLGVGTYEGGKIPYGYRYKKDKSGNEVVSKLNNNSLKKLSEETDGRYFEISENKNDLKSLIKAINNIEGTVKASRQVDASNNIYYYFLAGALALFLVDLLFAVQVFRI